MTADPALLAAIRAAVREELEAHEARRRRERQGRRRLRSPELAAQIAREAAPQVDEVARQQGRSAVARLRRRWAGGV